MAEEQGTGAWDTRERLVVEPSRRKGPGDGVLSGSLLPTLLGPPPQRARGLSRARVSVSLCLLGHHAGLRHHQREVLRQHPELDSEH